MGDSIEDLARAIALYVEGRKAVSMAMDFPLKHLRESAALSRARPFVAPPHRYGPLIARAAVTGIGGTASAIAERLHAVDARLPWGYHYPSRSAEDVLAEQIGFAELIGPDGPLDAPHCRVGFTVMAEHTTYPLHTHPAVELYLVVAGTARWLTNRSDRIVPPGEFILHHAQQPHAMQTFAEPLLALWAWSGEIEAPAVYL